MKFGFRSEAKVEELEIAKRLALETHTPFWWAHLEWDLRLSQRHIEQFLL